MRILCLDIPAAGASPEKYAPHLTAEALHAWGLYKSGVIRDIYFRQDRPGVAIFLECDAVDEAMNVNAVTRRVRHIWLSFMQASWPTANIWMPLHTKRLLLKHLI